MDIDQLQDWNFCSDSRLFVLTGAGVSAESGIDTFRDSDGLWEGHDVMTVATPEGFAANPELVIEFYNQRRAKLYDVVPNAGHIALTELGLRLGPERFSLVTQNVDDLHERSGWMETIHMHGELRKLRCLGPGAHVMPWLEDQSGEDRCPICSAALRPHIVWFGEIPLMMDEIEKRLRKCTHFIAIGTSALVYPAAGFKGLASANGAKVMVVNLDSSVDQCPDTFFVHGKAGELLPSLTKDWL